ncbi:helix-turn-helix transcriptional regulator [Streptomyces sp. NBC_01591]|uniref:helix-turn-helix domain-containing protein n=1 Tax=Streptomyces sp. NBC_01591 TaxID=2975888 RepID=UPI002DDA5EF6|nr:helix-turn-helix transcriptional regulator [Streptomyces sp. NBC_01591]WSD71881.1 helix-turn-helix transcriptional regulator [Streptomyces sp. NBC_01591]
MPPRDLTRLAQAVKARRLQLGLARKKAADEVGMSKDTWQRVEEAKPVRALNYAKIDRVLGWATGTCEAVGDGGDPVPAEESGSASGVTIADATERDLTVQRVVESASIGVTDLSASEIRALSARIVEDLKKAGVI